NLEVSAFVIEKPDVSGPYIAVTGQSGSGSGLILEIADEHSRRLELHFAVVSEPQIDIRERPSHRVRENLPVGLRGEVQKSFGLPVKLFEVQTKRTKEREHLGTDRLTGRVGDPHAGEPEHVLQRSVDHDLANHIDQPAGKRHVLPIQQLFAVAFRDTREITKE